MEDLVQALRIIYDNNGPTECGQAADALENLSERVSALESKVKKATSMLEWCDTHWRTHVYEGSPSVNFLSEISSFIGSEPPCWTGAILDQ